MYVSAMKLTQKLYTHKTTIRFIKIFQLGFTVLFRVYLNNPSTTINENDLAY